MHIYFSGIGGTGLAPLALIAKEAGFEVSGSDKQKSSNTEFLQKKGVKNIHVGQSIEQIAAVHDKKPIDWLVYSSALPADAPELKFCKREKIKATKRDELINLILKEKNLKLIAVAGTQGKTTTTAIIVWLFKQLGIPISYSVGATISFGDAGHYEEGSEYFVYECDEYDRNFLAFEPFISIITGVSWDHQDVFPTREDYQAAFREFIGQSARTILWQEDFEYLKLDGPANLFVQDSSNPLIELTKLPGRFNRLDAWLAMKAVQQLSRKPLEKIMAEASKFPGSGRRMEKLAPNLYSDYAHTPEKIRGSLSTALEIAQPKNQNIVVVYEPHSNARQHHILDEYQDSFAGVAQIYWLPTYLAREDREQRVIPPEELISHLSDPTLAEPAEKNAALKTAIQNHLKTGDLVVAMSAGDLDTWLRKEFKK